MDPTNKVKIYIKEDERFPEYVLSDTAPKYGRLLELEIDVKTLNRWKRTYKAFNKAQDEIRKLLDE